MRHNYFAQLAIGIGIFIFLLSTILMIPTFKIRQEIEVKLNKAKIEYYERKSKKRVANKTIKYGSAIEDAPRNTQLGDISEYYDNAICDGSSYREDEERYRF